ncbi:MAG: hypothetical protein GPJ54_17900 [Candidatus Heimdallarchaeota archaeon]|nr:hypothetical protein [Candidatus Heimdallarchaeota archaeon]
MKKYLVLILSMTMLFSSIPFWMVGSTQLDVSQNDTNRITIDQTHENPGVFKLVNFNIIAGAGGEDNNWTEILIEENAEVLALVETGRWKLSDGSFDEAVIEINSWFPNEKPYDAVTFEPVGTTDGQVIFSRYPIIDSNTISSYPLDDGTMYKLSHPLIVALLNIDGHEIYVVAEHNSCCQLSEVRSDEQEAINNYFDSLGPDVAIIYTGDLNNPPLENRIHNPEKEQDWDSDNIEMLLNSSHPQTTVNHVWTDTFRVLNPDYHQYPGYTAEGAAGVNQPDRIDYTMVNQHLTHTLVSAKNKLRGFDHGHVTNVFNLNPDEVNLRPPLPPTGISIDVDVQNVQATISWDPNLEEDFYKYQLYREKCLITEIPKGQNSFLDDYFYEDNTIYNYELKAVDWEENISQLSSMNYVNTSKGNLDRPGQPVLSTKTVSGGVLLSWTLDDTGNAPITQYEMLRATIPGYPLNTVRFISGHLTNFTDTSISKPGINVIYQLRAFSLVGRGPSSVVSVGTSGLNSNSISTSNTLPNSQVHRPGVQQVVGCPDTIQTLVYIPPPSQVTGLIANTVSSNQIDLIWTGNTESNIESYSIYREGTLVGTSVTNSYSDSDLTPLTEYTYEVSAVGEDGQEGPKSEILTVSTLGELVISSQTSDSSDTPIIFIFTSMFISNIILVIIKKRKT